MELRQALRALARRPSTTTIVVTVETMGTANGRGASLLDFDDWTHARERQS
jgi:hypothetical protein